MDLGLTFASGTMAGHGSDDVGRFMIRGQYDAKSLECSWTKTYLGAHEVFYRGFREGKGIWGTWEITPSFRGGFHIWPKILGGGEAQTESVEQESPVSTTVEETEQRKLSVHVPKNRRRPTGVALRRQAVNVQKKETGVSPGFL